jgi:transposase-like protein
MKSLHVYAGKINKRKVPSVKKSAIKQDEWQDFEGNKVDSEHMILSLLIPSAVKEFMRKLDEEVSDLCGSRFQRNDSNYQRWGNQDGSIVLANQKIRIQKPRVRDKSTRKEILLKKYQTFQNPEVFDRAVFQDGLRKISQRDYSQGVSKISSSFGFAKSSVSRRYTKTLENKLKELNERDISRMNIISVMIDGKRFKQRGVIIALGISDTGKKYILGLYESSTENSQVCHELLEDLAKRGLPQREILFVVDGGKGLNTALEERYAVSDVEKRRAVKIRCYVHKWENIKSKLNQEAQEIVKPMFWAMREASSLDIAKNCADRIEAHLEEFNISALNSFLEAKEDLLNIHRLKLTPSLKKFFSTTNAIESLNYLLEEDLRRVKYWRSSKQFQMWVASSCLMSEKRMKKVRGYKNLIALRVALKNLCQQQESLDCQAINE